MKKTKSAAHRLGLLPCPSCNQEGNPSDQVTGECAWCWNEAGFYARYVPVDKAIEWRQAHPNSDYEIPTSPQTPAARSITPIPDTDPDPERKP